MGDDRELQLVSLEVIPAIIAVVPCNRKVPTDPTLVIKIKTYWGISKSARIFWISGTP